MLSWLRRRRETAERIDAEADVLIGELGIDAYAEARRREYEPSNNAIALRWNQVALAVAHKTGTRIELDTSNRMAMNAIFAPDREHDGDRQPSTFQSGRGAEKHPRPKAVPSSVYQLCVGSRTANCDRSRDSSLGAAQA